MVATDHSPLEIEIGLHYWTRADDYRGGDFSAPAVREALQRFVGGGLLAEGPVRMWDDRKYRPTAGMGVWVAALCAVPWPLNVWVMPSSERAKLARAVKL